MNKSFTNFDAEQKKTQKEEQKHGHQNQFEHEFEQEQKVIGLVRQ